MLRCYADKLPTPKILDFGLAKLRDADQKNALQLTQLGQVYGSPLFMSPEQVNGLALDERSDIYSLGCVLYTALTGVPPFLGDSGVQVLLAHLQQPVTPLHQLRPDLHFTDSLERVIAKALAKSPDERYQRMEQFRQDLEVVVSQLPR